MINSRNKAVFSFAFSTIILGFWSGNPTSADTADDLLDMLEAHDEGRPLSKDSDKSSKSILRETAPIDSDSGAEQASSEDRGQNLRQQPRIFDDTEISAGAQNEPVYRQWENLNFQADEARVAGDDKRAENLYMSAIEAAKGITYGGPAGISTYGLARTLHQQGRREEAAKYYEAALDIFDNSTRRRRVSYLVACIKDYATLLREMGRNQEASVQESRLPQSLRR